MQGAKGNTGADAIFQAPPISPIPQRMVTNPAAAGPVTFPKRDGHGDGRDRNIDRTAKSSFGAFAGQGVFEGVGAAPRFWRLASAAVISRRPGAWSNELTGSVLMSGRPAREQ